MLIWRKTSCRKLFCVFPSTTTSISQRSLPQHNAPPKSSWPSNIYFRLHNFTFHRRTSLPKVHIAILQQLPSISSTCRIFYSNFQTSSTIPTFIDKAHNSNITLVDLTSTRRIFYSNIQTPTSTISKHYQQPPTYTKLEHRFSKSTVL